MNDEYSYRNCPRCYSRAEKYYTIGQHYFWRCTNMQCPRADVDDPKSEKYGYKKPKEDEKTEPNFKIKVSKVNDITPEEFWEEFWDDDGFGAPF